jgi:hypothetical protein
MVKRSDQFVRFYFEIILSCLIPRDPHLKRGGISRGKWETSFLFRMQSEIEEKFSKEGLDAQYRKYTPINEKLRVYAVHFVVSALHPFPAAQLFVPRGRHEFGVKSKFFVKEKLLIEEKIKKILGKDYVVNAISYQYAASRSFMFFDDMVATLKIKRVISEEEIYEADGLIRGAIENFNNEVTYFLQQYGWLVWPMSTRSRPKDDVYEFEAVAEIQRKRRFQATALRGSGLA